MQGRKKSSFFEKLLIAGVGVIGGIMIGKKIAENASEQKKQEIKVEDRPMIHSKNLEDYDKIEELMTCPISGELMTDPVIVIECGHTFERKMIEEWVQKNSCCPMCKKDITGQSLRPNFQLREVIAVYQQEKETTKGKMEESRQ